MSLDAGRTKLQRLLARKSVFNLSKSHRVNLFSANDLPYNDYFEYFGPDFKLHIQPKYEFYSAIRSA